MPAHNLTTEQMQEAVDAVAEAGDTTFVRSVTLKPSPPSLDYHCGKCGKRITDYTESYIDPETTKLHLVARCHGDRAEIVVFLRMGGELFGG